MKHKTRSIIKGAFVSIWDGNVYIETSCKINLETKEVFNLYNKEFTEKEIKDYIKRNITKETVDCFVAHIADCTNRRTTIDWIVKNLLRIKYNNEPEPRG